MGFEETAARHRHPGCRRRRHGNEPKTTNNNSSSPPPPKLAQEPTINQ